MLDDIKSKDEVLKDDLAIVVSEILKNVSDVVSIVLCGGYGRGEGSWYVLNNNWHPYNDYDISIIGKRRISGSIIARLEREIPKLVNVKWVDVDQYVCDELIKLSPTIKNYDLLNGSSIIYGRKDVFEGVANISPSDISKKEVLVLYFTRLYTLIGSFGDRGLLCSKNGESSRFFRNQMAKAVLAIVDANLLMCGEYDYSYKARVNRYSDLIVNNSELVDLCRWALEEKLEPKSIEMNKEDVLDLYSKVHNYYLDAMYRSIGEVIGKKISGPDDIECYMLKSIYFFAKKLYWLARYQNLKRADRVFVKVAQSFIVAAWHVEGIDICNLRRGLDLLRYVDSRIPANLSWDEACLEAVRLRMET